MSCKSQLILHAKEGESRGSDGVHQIHVILSKTATVISAKETILPGEK